MTPQWLDWARRLQAAAQSGLAFTQNPFEVERYEEIRRIAAEMMAAGADGQVEKVEGLFTDKEGYATPQIDVRGMVFDAEDRILLVKERSDGKRAPPGGFADVGVSLGENVVKEIREESGYETRAVRRLATELDIVGDPPRIAFEIYMVDRVAAHQRHKELASGLGGLPAA